MARSQNTFQKKEREKKKAQKRKMKEEKRASKKENEAGSFEDMIVYVDEFGNFVDTPPEEREKKKEIDAEDIEISTPKAAPIDMDAERRGKVTFFNERKGYGFIEQLNSQEKFFVHESNLIDKIKDNDQVKFKIEKGEKGFNAIKVEKLK